MKNCKTRTVVRNTLLEQKAIDTYNNIIIPRTQFVNLVNKINNYYRDNYKVAGAPLVMDDTTNKFHYNKEYLDKVDVVRNVVYGDKENIHYKNTFIGSTMTSFETKDLTRFPLERGDIVLHKNEVFIFIGYNEKGLQVYTPKPLEGNKMKFIPADEIEVFNQKVDFVTYNTQPYVILPNQTVVHENGSFYDSGVLKSKVIEMRTYLRNLEIGMEDVTIQLYADSQRTMSYKDFVATIAKDIARMKYNYSLQDIRDAIKCY